MNRSLFVVVVLVSAFAAACGSSGVSAPSTDLGQDTNVGFQDTCVCQADADCKGKGTTDQCTEDKCVACSCTVKPKADNTKCDDGAAGTLDDVCTAGVCKGRTPSKGDGKCDAGFETCQDSPDDCKCAADKFCYADPTTSKYSCVAKPVTNNGKCEPTENCEDDIKDCACPSGQGCFEKKCVDCPSFCKGNGYACNKVAGCDCGKCEAGYMCDAVNHCYKSTTCGLGGCEAAAGENCGTCPSDCGCGAGKVCVENACTDCAPICDKAGIECGTYQGCDCGACQDGYNCKAGKCAPKCDWVCYNKECGEIDGCKCGALKGECPAGEECVNHACLKECGSLCLNGDGTEKECGWGEDCLCGFCDGCDACFGNKCQAGATADSNEPNETPDAAVDLGSGTDDPAVVKTVEGTIDWEFDEDWYKFEVSDTSGFPANPHPILDLTGIAEDKDIDLEICYKCAKGELVGAGLVPADSIVETTGSPAKIAGARCFTSVNLWGFAEHIELAPTCKSGGYDDSATIYIHVFAATEFDCGSPYTLKFHM